MKRRLLRSAELITCRLKKHSLDDRCLSPNALTWRAERPGFDPSKVFKAFCAEHLPSPSTLEPSYSKEMDRFYSHGYTAFFPTRPSTCPESPLPEPLTLRVSAVRLLVLVLILTTEMCERLAYYSIVAGMILYSTSNLGFDLIEAVILNQIFIGYAFLTPMLGGFLADSYLGRYRTIYISCILYICGLALVLSSAVKYHEWGWPETDAVRVQLKSFGLMPNVTAIYAILWTSPSTDIQRRWLFISGLGLIGLGTGGIKANVGPFGAEQIQARGREVLQSYFNWFYWVINLGSLMSFTAVAYVQQEVSFVWGFFIPTVSMCAGTLIFVSGQSLYTKTSPRGSILVVACGICGQGACRSKPELNPDKSIHSTQSKPEHNPDLSIHSTQSKPKLNPDLSIHSTQSKPKLNPDLSIHSTQSKPELNPDLSIHSAQSKPEPNLDLCIHSTQRKPELNPDLSIHSTQRKPEPNPDKSIHSTQRKPELNPDLSIHFAQSKPEPNPDLSIHSTQSKPELNPDLSIHSTQSKPKLNPDLSIHSTQSKPELNPDLSIHSTQRKPELNPDLSIHFAQSKPEPNPDLSIHSAQRKPESNLDLSIHSTQSKPELNTDLSIHSTQSKPKPNPHHSIHSTQSKPEPNPDLSIHSTQSKPELNPDLSIHSTQSKP
ncbi:hypothetical protein EGW08_009657 [Elysia chlorotica]|uniref:Major facilitator superfamily (MFS) profile domain-containing protein n=1 Tax=Elysia chlorotica TaxID=188477 RepID=A0A433TLX1_ELYCH|nr:hypothetical protein EGW08_009657 [Elysia chlorotica]